MLLHERSHHLDSLTSRSGTLESNVNQRPVINTKRQFSRANLLAIRVPKFLSTTKSGLCDAHLQLIHLSHHIVGSLCLRNLTQILVGVPFIYLSHFTFGMHTTLLAIHIAIHTIRVSIITHHHTALSTRFLPYNHICPSRKRGKHGRCSPCNHRDK